MRTLSISDNGDGTRTATSIGNGGRYVVEVLDETDTPLHTAIVAGTGPGKDPGTVTVLAAITSLLASRPGETIHHRDIERVCGRHVSRQAVSKAAGKVPGLVAVRGRVGGYRAG